MDIYNAIVSFFSDGGLFMYPIAVVLFVGLAVAIERFIYLEKAKKANSESFDAMLPLLRNEEYDKVEAHTKTCDSAISRIIAQGLEAKRVSPRRETMEHAMQEGVLETLPRLSKRTGFLAILANVATLMGLLGTIIGLIAAFTAVANADPADKASLLSESISVAMNTTAFGLITAIPLLLLHYWLLTKTTEIIDSIEMCGVKFLNAVSIGAGLRTGSRNSDD